MLRVVGCNRSGHQGLNGYLLRPWTAWLGIGGRCRRYTHLLAEHLSEADDDGARMARQLTKHRAHLLPYLSVKGLAATNNDAER